MFKNKHYMLNIKHNSKFGFHIAEFDKCRRQIAAQN